MRRINSVIFFLILIMLNTTAINAQESFTVLVSSKIDSLKIQAQRMTNATLFIDSLTIIKHSYPGIVDRFFGGEENVGTAIKNGNKDAEAMGFKNLNVSIGEFKNFAKNKNEIYTFIETKSVSVVREDTLKSESFLLAISQNGGIDWYFIDASFIWATDIKTLYPNYNGTIPIPAKKEPMYTQKN